jgi:starch synthase
MIRPKEVVHVAREYGNLLGAGGLRDSTKGICAAAGKLGIKNQIFLPHPNREIDLTKFQKIGEPLNFKVRMDYGKKCIRSEEVVVTNFFDLHQKNLVFHFVDTNRFRYLSESDNAIERQGIYTYTDKEAKLLGKPELYGKGYHDNFEINVLLVKSTLHALEKLKINPDIIHCHDGHTALLPFLSQYSQDNFALYLHDIPTLVTIYNATNRYRGEVFYDDSIQSICRIPDYILQGCIHQRKFEPLLAAGLSGATINTVSENYARELQKTGKDVKSGWIGHKLAGIGIEIVGITSGIDPEVHNSEKYIKKDMLKLPPCNQDFSNKISCKLNLLKQCALKPASERTILLTFVGRLVSQKGYDILCKVISSIFREDKDVVLIGNGSGHKDVVEELKALESQFRNRIYIETSYNPKFCNQIFSAGDFFLLPSHYEPCGLTDFVAQLHGNIPIVHRVGGLVKVIDNETGFSYQGGDTELLDCLRNAISTYRTDKNIIKKIQRQAVINIFEHFTWDKVFSQKYLPLYKQTIDRAKPILPY